MKYIAVYLPYFAFVGVVVAGLHYKNYWIMGFGISFFFMYDLEPALKIICGESKNNHSIHEEKE